MAYFSFFMSSHVTEITGVNSINSINRRLEFHLAACFLFFLGCYGPGIEHTDRCWLNVSIMINRMNETCAFTDMKS